MLLLDQKGWEALSLVAAENARLVENENSPFPCSSLEEIMESYDFIVRQNNIFIYQNVGISEIQSNLFRG